MINDTPPCRVVITPRDEKLAAQDSVREWCEQVPRRLRKKGWL